MARLAGRPQDYLGETINLSADSVAWEPHRRSGLDHNSLVDLYQHLDRTESTGRSWLRPVVVDRESMDAPVVLGGERRWAAMARAGTGRAIAVYRIRDWAGLVAWMSLDEKSHHKTGMTLLEVATLTVKVLKYVAHTSTDPIDETFADMYGYSVQELRTTRYAVNAVTALPVELQDKARAELAQIDTGALKPATVFGRIREIGRRHEALLRALPLDAQRGILTRSMATLEGLVDALESMGPISSGMTVNERAVWEKKTIAARRTLDRLARELKGGNEKA